MSQDIDAIISEMASKSKKKSTEPDKPKKKLEPEKELDEPTKSAYNDLASGLPDYYKIMGCSPNDSNEEIKKKCKTKLAQFHPDKTNILLEKLPFKDRAAQKKLYDAQYKLIRDAYKILNDPESRKFYDLQKKTSDSKNFAKQKTSFEDFIKQQESEVNDQSKTNAALKYKESMADLDKKHKYDRELATAPKLDKESINKRILDLKMIREQQDLEYIPNNKFEDIPFTNKEFNKQWDKQQRKKSNKHKNTDDRSLMKWDGISAANDMGLHGSNDYVSLESNYEDVYNNDDLNTSTYASILDSDDSDDSENEGEDPNDDSDDEPDDNDYYEGHNSNKQLTANRYDQLLKQRNEEDQQYETEEFSSKMRQTVMDNPMNISSQFGKVIGDTKVASISYDKNNGKKVDKNLVEAYKTLTFDSNKKK